MTLTHHPYLEEYGIFCSCILFLSLAIVSALKALQEKIRQLEADKKAPLKGLDYMKNVSEDTVDTLINPCTSRNQGKLATYPLLFSKTCT